MEQNLTEWAPLRGSVASNKSPKYLLILVNQPIRESDTTLLTNLWNNSLFRGVTDGAANRLVVWAKEKRDMFIPDLISGDFDSATSENLDFYRSKGAKIVETEDQDETDFMKCLRIAVERMQQSSCSFDAIYVYGAFGGRIDHVFGNIHTLFWAEDILKIQKPVYLVGEGSLACLLQPGKHHIHVGIISKTSKVCGLVPVGSPCKNVTTTGLKWNLNNQQLAFGKLISTSNEYISDLVTVENSEPLLWTMELS